jgi:hypothetical protein
MVAMGGKTYGAFETASYDQMTLNDHAIAKFEHVRSAARKNVTITNPSPQELLTLPVHVSQQVRGTDVYRAGRFGSGTQDSWLRNSFLRHVTEVELGGVRYIRGNKENIYGEGWSSPRISPAYPRAQRNDLVVVGDELVVGNGKYMSALDSATVSNLSPSDKGQKKRSEEQKTSEAGNWIVFQFLKIFIEPWMVTAVIGGVSIAIGVTLYLDFYGWLSATGFVLIAAGLLTPIFPWWVFVVFPFEGK